MVRRKGVWRKEIACCIFRVSRRVGTRQKGEEVENVERNKGVSDIVPSDIQGGK